jgi:hypothetical protein
LNKLYYKQSLIGLLVCLASSAVFAQVTVSGTVYDITKKTPIEAVSVLSTSGTGTVTDSTGQYSITVRDTDSIYFSYLNKPTHKFAVTTIQNPGAFDISILKKLMELPPVFVKQRNYKFDSLKNRQDYASIFNYKKPGLSTTTNNSPGGVGASLDLTELINMFRFRKTQRTLAFQRRLVQQEQDKYIDHRFSKGLVKKLTGLSTPELEAFMKEYRPTYEMSIQLNDLEFGHFIVEAHKYYAKKTGVNTSAGSPTHF